MYRGKWPGLQAGQTIAVLTSSSTYLGIHVGLDHAEQGTLQESVS